MKPLEAGDAKLQVQWRSGSLVSVTMLIELIELIDDAN
jgi:hypothetical protein